MCSIDLEPCEVWCETEVRARKAHACDPCGGAIRAGEKYVRHFSVYDGHARSEKVCAACEAVRTRFYADHGTIPQPGEFMTTLYDCIQGDRTSEWRVPLAAMRRRERAARRSGGTGR